MKSSGFGAIRRTSQGASTTAFTTYLNIKDNGGGCPQLEKMDGEHPKKARTYAQVGSASAGMRPWRGLYCVSPTKRRLLDRRKTEEAVPPRTRLRGNPAVPDWGVLP